MHYAVRHTRSRNFLRLLLGDVGFLQSCVGASFESVVLAGRPWVGGFSLGWWVYWLLSSMSLPIFISSTFPLADEIPNGVEEWRDRQCSTRAASHLPSSQLLEPTQHYPSLWSRLSPWATTPASRNKTGIMGWWLGGGGRRDQEYHWVQNSPLGYKCLFNTKPTANYQRLYFIPSSIVPALKI